MHIVVLGAGVVGAATAWYLAADGHRVTLVDRHHEAGREASLANGGQLSYRYVAPLAGPGVLGKLPRWLLSRDAPVALRPRLDPAQWAWCLAFAARCNRRDSDAASARLLALGQASREQVHALLAAEPGLEFAHATAGKLVVFRDADALDAGRRQMALQAEIDRRAGVAVVPQRFVDADGCVAIEPALAALAPALAGGIHTPDEEVGDCHRFSRGLVERMLARSPASRTLFGVNVRSVHRRGHRVVGVETDLGLVDADAVVVATGADAPTLLRPLGIRLPVQPVKGHSIDAPILDDSAAPRVSITDLARKTVYARIGDRLRVAGFADIVGPDRRIDPRRDAALRRQLAATFPGASDVAGAAGWAGLRPATPDGLPILGPTPLDGLWLNVGHGPLGFTLAAACARAVADQLAGRPSRVPAAGLALASRRPGRAGSRLGRPQAA